MSSVTYGLHKIAQIARFAGLILVCVVVLAAIFAHVPPP
jgi:hypothetical protein